MIDSPESLTPDEWDAARRALEQWRTPGPSSAADRLRARALLLEELAEEAAAWIEAACRLHPDLAAPGWISELRALEAEGAPESGEDEP